MIKTVSVTRLPKVPLVRRVGLVIDIWILFTHKIVYFQRCS